MVNRRETLGLMGASAVTLTLTRCAFGEVPASSPLPLSPLPMLMGFRTYVDSLSWRPDLGSLLLVVDPSGSEAPVMTEIPASWMWHSVNAYERDNTIIAVRQDLSPESTSATHCRSVFMGGGGPPSPQLRPGNTKLVEKR
jgi:Retinal pigment epithelial membrane protein